MIPLAKATRIRVGKTTSSISWPLSPEDHGSLASTANPGPLIVAEEFNVSLISMIIAGCCVGLCSSATGLNFLCSMA